MGDTTTLRALIEAVEAGTFMMDALPWPHEVTAYEAFSGSLDAAKALHEALLPEWDWTINGNGQAVVWPPGSADDQNRGSIETDIEGQPARALLLAALRARLAEQEAGDD